MIVALPFGYFRNNGAENRIRTDDIQFLVLLLCVSFKAESNPAHNILKAGNLLLYHYLLYSVLFHRCVFKIFSFYILKTQILILFKLLELNL